MRKGGNVKKKDSRERELAEKAANETEDDSHIRGTDRTFFHRSQLRCVAIRMCTWIHLSIHA